MITSEAISQLYETFERTLNSSDPVQYTDKATQYIVAKAMLNEIATEEDFSQLFLNISKTQAFEYFSKPKSIFSSKCQEFVRFECKTENLNQEILKNYKGFNIWGADDFKVYLQRSDFDSSILEAIISGRNVLIEGPPDCGKTRLVYETVKNLKSSYIFSLFQSYLPKIKNLNLLASHYIEPMRLIWFIDDLHFFDQNPQIIYEKLISAFEEVTVIVTLKSGEPLPNLPIFQSIKKYTIGYWCQKDLKKLSELNLIPLAPIQGETPSSLICNFDKLSSHYLRFKADGGDCLNVLQYLKLLSVFLEKIDYKLLEGVFLNFRKEISTKNDFEKAVSKLNDCGFLAIREGYVTYKDSLFTVIIADEDYYNIESDMKDLIPILIEIKRVRELFMLGSYYLSIKEFGLHILCNKRIIKNIDLVKDYQLGLIAYIDLGNTLLIKFVIEKNQKNLFEACKVFEEASTYIERFDYTTEEFSQLFVCWGIVLNDLSNSTGQIEFSKQACEKFETAEIYGIEGYWPYFHWASALQKLGYFFEETPFLHDACDKYQLAAQANPSFEGIYQDWGIILYDLASLTGNINYCIKACEKFSLASELNSDSSSTYYKWGEALTTLGYYHKDPTFFEEARNKYKLASSIEKDFVEAHFNCGMMSIELAQMDIDSTTNYSLACSSFEMAIKHKKDYAQAYFQWGIALMELGYIHLDIIYFQKAASKFKFTTIYQDNHGHAYFSWSVALINLNRLTNKRHHENLIFDNLYRAYFFFILENEWDIAISLAKEYFLKNKDLNDITIMNHDLIVIFNAALMFLIRPEIIMQCNFEELIEYKKFNNSVPISMVVDAITEGKEPKLEYETNKFADTLALNTAIYLAHNIISKFPSLA